MAASQPFRDLLGLRLEMLLYDLTGASAEHGPGGEGANLLQAPTQRIGGYNKIR